jgi:organizing structure protein 2
MAGGILTRRKIWPVRAVTPVLVGVAAAWCFIPETARNVGDLLWEWERKVPRVAETHLVVRKNVEGGLRRTAETIEEGRRKVDEAAKGVRKTVEELVKKG